MTTVTSFAPRTRRNVELLLAAARRRHRPARLRQRRPGDRTAPFPPACSLRRRRCSCSPLAFHLVLRWRAPYADPLLLPIATLLNGLGLVMIHRLDLAHGAHRHRRPARCSQLIWTALGVVIAVVVLIVLRDHRLLRRYTFTAMAVGLVLLLLPLLPGIGRPINGSRIWIGLGPFTFQPGEFAKIAAGHLLRRLPRADPRRARRSPAARSSASPSRAAATSARSSSPGWLSLGVLVFEKDLGSSLLFFGLFVAMLYVATERASLDRHRPGPVLRRRLPAPT